MRRLRTIGPAIHQIPHQGRAYRGRVIRDILRDLQRSLDRLLGRGGQLAEQFAQERVIGGVRETGGCDVQGAGVADEAWEEVRGCGFHDDAAAGEDEADLGGACGEADCGGERHGDADADGGAVDGHYGGFAAAVDGEGDAAAAV